ncbi:phosphotransferase family protein [Kibdelosporangium aridum]|uniref:phosphotransferase family protein n=1 Tax=Kibdelosporangium aridum TaxID=2030 RepID=UPI00052500FC
MSAESSAADTLTHALGGVTVGQVSRLSGGASLETWVATVTCLEGTSKVILRRDRPGPPQSNRMEEAAVLRQMASEGVPVPAVLAAGPAGENGTAYLVLEFLEGETIPRKVLRDHEFAAARGVLTADVGRALAGIHRVQPARLPFLPAALTPRESVERLAEAAERFGDGMVSPVFALAARRLLETAPAAGEPVVVHGDLRTGNLMVGPRGLVAVLDWELAHLGHPGEDLGWFCVRAWRFGNDAHEAGGFGSRDELLAAYAQAGGRSIGKADLDFWELHGTLKWGVTCLSQVAVHLSGHARSVELAAIGRRVSEVEYDLIQLMRRA